jgi:hypothetical protein
VDIDVDVTAIHMKHYSKIFHSITGLYAPLEEEAFTFCQNLSQSGYEITFIFPNKSQPISDASYCVIKEKL